MRVLLRGGMETWREVQCTSQLSAQPIIVTLLCPRPRTETNLHAHCQRWRARTHLMDGERAMFHISVTMVIMQKLRSCSTRPRAGVRAVTALGRRASPGVHTYRPGLEVHTRLRLGVCNHDVGDSAFPPLQRPPNSKLIWRYSTVARRRPEIQSETSVDAPPH
jgi:hypothetical protein